MALVAMYRDHLGHGAVLDPVLDVCRELAAAPERHAAHAPALLRAGRVLCAHLDAHLGAEERTIFPAIAHLVPEDERRRMVDEVRGRRGAGAAAHSSR